MCLYLYGPVRLRGAKIRRGACELRIAAEDRKPRTGALHTPTKAGERAELEHDPGDEPVLAHVVTIEPSCKPRNTQGHVDWDACEEMLNSIDDPRADARLVLTELGRAHLLREKSTSG